MARRLKKGRVKTLASDGLVPLQSPARQYKGIRRATNDRWGQGERISPEQAEALSWLTEDYQRPVEITERLGLKLTPSQIRGRFATLCKKGLAERECDTGRVRLTALGGAERVGVAA